MKKFVVSFMLVALLGVGAVFAHDGGHGGPLGAVPVPVENPITEEKRILGKILFWDEQLSSNNRVSCGTCHIPSSGGADPRTAWNPGLDSVFGTDDDIVGSLGVPRVNSSGTSVNDPDFGFDEQVTGRAAPSNLMSSYSHSNFWDGRATGEFVDPEDGTTVVIASGGALESQAVQPILSAVEMADEGRTWDDVRDKLAGIKPLLLASNIPEDMQTAVDANPMYEDLFNAAFGSSEINAKRIAMAIATYQRTLVPDDTPWDRFIDGDMTALTPEQEIGWNFLNVDMNCFHCHAPPQFTDNQFHNIGLRPASDDMGRENVSGDVNDRGSFRTPTLRNIGLRATLGHNGRLMDTADAIDFYLEENGHVQFTQNQSQIPLGEGQFLSYSVLSVPVESGNGTPIRANVIDFLENGLTDARVQDEEYPFDRPKLITEGFQLLILYCDSTYIGMEDGTISKPYDTLEEALLHVQDNAEVRLIGDQQEPITIDQPVALMAWSGAVTIGATP